MKLFGNQQLLKILITVAILVFLAYKNFSINFERHQQYRNALVLIQEKDAIFNQDVLKSRYQTLVSYDSLVKNLANLKNIFQDLQAIPGYLQQDGKEEIRDNLLNLQKIVQQKEAYIERFKSKNAALKNSLYYLPELVTQLKKDRQDRSWLSPSITILNTLLYDILIYNQTPNEELKSNILKELNKLDLLKNKYEIKEEDFSIALTKSHVNIILDNKPIVDNLTDRILQYSISQSSQNIEDVYDIYFQKALRNLNIYRFLTYAWSLAIVIVIAYLATRKLFRINREITALNSRITSLNEGLQEENLRMGAELTVARKLQQMLLPKSEELRAIDELDISAFMEPAEEIGGDYYDVLDTDGIVTIGIGDVTGHGLESGILMLMTQMGVRTLKEMGEEDPVKFLNTLNRTIYRNIQRMNSYRNLTLAILNYARGRVSISGQHEEILVVRSRGDIERIDTMDLGLPIGLDEEIANFISHSLVELSPGDGIVLYTDGITEARDGNKNAYGIERLCKIIAQNWHYCAREIQQAAIEDVRKHIGEQKVLDDLTLLVFKLRTFNPV